MKWLNRLLAGALLLVCASSPSLAVQSSGCMPVTGGPYTGVAFSNLISAGFASLISTNSGTSAPATNCAGTTVQGQQWFDTSLSTPAWRIWDGTQGLATGRVDPTNHVWMPQIGGGIATLASAATVDLCSIPQDSINISGTTAITSLGSSCATGQIKIISFAAALTLTYNASTIILPTAANVTTAAGDVAIAAYQGSGVWQVVSYSTASGTPLAMPAIHYAGEDIQMFAPSCPAGTLAANGSAVSRTTYASLFSAIGTTWGAGDGSTTFNLPSTGGYFLRGWISGQSVDSGRTFGSTQQDQLQDHVHPYNATNTTNADSSGACCGSNNGSFGTSTGTPSSGNHGSETRPKSITIYHCIVTGNSP